MEDLRTRGKSLKPASVDDRRRGHDEADATALGPAEAIVDNLLICAAVHGSGSGPLEPKAIC